MKKATIIVGESRVNELVRDLIAEGVRFEYEPRPYQQHAFTFEERRLQRFAKSYPRAKIEWRDGDV